MIASLLQASLRDERHDLPLWSAIGLHLLPGVFIVFFYLLVLPLLASAKVPSMAAIYLAILVILVPLELGFLLYLGKRRNGRLSLEGIVLNREGIPLSQYLWFVPALVIWGVAVFVVIGVPLDRMVTQQLLFWLPAQFQPAEMVMTAASIGGFPRAALLVCWVGAVLVNGIAGPVVEEYYFRGYLMPRMKALGQWAPLVNVALFSLYHFFSPWQNVSRILAFAPMAYAVWWKRDLRIGILMHCMINIGYLVMQLPLILRAG